MWSSWMQNNFLSEEILILLFLDDWWLKVERWQGPPNIAKVEQYEIVLTF